MLLRISSNSRLYPDASGYHDIIQKRKFMNLKLMAPAVLFLASTLTFAAQKYDIKVSRPLSRDFTYMITGVRDIDDLTRVTDTEKKEVLNDSTIKEKCSFKGNVQVTDVDENGIEVTKKITVVECKLIKDKTETELLPAGSVLTASWAGGGLEIVNEKNEAVSEELHDAIKDFFTRNGSDFENIKISETPRSVGEKWEISGAADSFLESIGNSMVVDKKDVKITAQLTEVKKINGIETMKVDLEVLIAKFGMPENEGNTVNKSTISLKYAILLPVDGKTPSMGQELSMTIDIDMSRAANTEEGTPAMNLVKKSNQYIKITNSFDAPKPSQKKIDEKKGK
jgi:hypothetical protein